MPAPSAPVALGASAASTFCCICRTKGNPPPGLVHKRRVVEGPVNTVDCPLVFREKFLKVATLFNHGAGLRCGLRQSILYDVLAGSFDKTE
ncbi:hypothetical protein SAMN02927924_03342 [Sphingobium faniae]|nr:hypothetical protein SAMN02927924_03342 [Sphingobium faniae]